MNDNQAHSTQCIQERDHITGSAGGERLCNSVVAIKRKYNVPSQGNHLIRASPAVTGMRRLPR
jgi:hypothetical protein